MGAAPRFEPVGRRAVHITDRLLELTFQIAVYFTANLRTGFSGGLACKSA